MKKVTGTPNSVKVASVTRAQVQEIAETKMPDLNADKHRISYAYDRRYCTFKWDSLLLTNSVNKENHRRRLTSLSDVEDRKSL